MCPFIAQLLGLFYLRVSLSVPNLLHVFNNLRVAVLTILISGLKSLQTDFRFYWLQIKLQEESIVSQVSANNPVSKHVNSILFETVLIPIVA